MVRYRFCTPFRLEASRIKQANYYTYDLSRMDKSHPRQKFKLHSVLEDWCSVLINWNEGIEIGGQTSEYGGNEPVLNFNITDEVKNWCGDPTGLAERKGGFLSVDHRNFCQIWV
ncbi:MAG: hypothetical protein PHH84_01905 [Oscillospiraceae bacterium]|nr:hypothetical protein [Oscillospiraceae bacterium]MDD4413452.1 hypothetical protein [Oscillospiraceae bacterium]